MVRVGAVAPSFVRLTAANPAASPDPLDFTTATLVTLRARRPDGRSATWAVTTETVSAGSIVVRHVFAPGDVDIAGPYRLELSFEIPGGTRRAGPTVLTVSE